jgi:hypothetical protein
MKRFRRTLWLAALGVWVWLGVGLHRELPRKLDVVCKLRLETSDSPMGFVKESNQFAVKRRSTISEPAILVFDASSGELLRSSTARRAVEFASAPDFEHGCESLFVNSVPTSDTGTELKEFNLTTGVWRTICNDRLMFLAMDHRRRIAVGCEPNEAVKKVTFLDLETGRTLLVRTIPTGWAYIASASVVEDLGLAVLPMAIWPKGQSRADAIKLEVYRLGPPVVLASTIDIAGHYELAAATASGLLALLCDPYESTIDVYDLKSQQWVFRGPADAAERPTPKHAHNGWGLSPSGRCVANGWGVWELQTGRRLWRASPHEFGSPWPDGRIYVYEVWSEYWKSLFPNRRFETAAWRNMDTGELEHRVRIPSSSVPCFRNADRSLGVSGDGHVYHLPPRVDWPLLALCQVVLATPLVALRATRRRRSERSAAPRG